MLAIVTLALLAPPPAPTWSAEVAPIVFGRCVECHRPGGGAPFRLDSYEAARRKARTMAEVVGERQMPPWPAAQGSELFAQARRLGDEEIATIRRWVEADCPLGDAAKVPPVPTFPSGWPLGEPDLVLATSEPFPVPAAGRDIYRHFALPITVDGDRWLAAIDIRSSDPSVVHHALYFFDPSGQSHGRVARDGKPGLAAGGVKRLQSLGGWAVGQRAQRHPFGLGHELRHDPDHPGDLVTQVHFHPDGKAREVRLEFALYFCKERPAKQLLEFQLPPAFGESYGIDIPAGDEDYEVVDRWETPADIDLVAVWAHAHQVCVEAEAHATLPDGRRIDLLAIPHWDFNWQMRYDYLAPLRLPKGTVVEGRLRYDNSESNPSNPHRPPERVRWGEQTSDEMGSLIFECMAASEADKPALAASYAAHAASVAAAGGGGPEAIRAIARRLDRNGDGVIEGSEIPKRMRNDVLAYDADGDGRVTLAEVDAVLAKRAAQDQPPTNAR